MTVDRDRSVLTCALRKGEFYHNERLQRPTITIRIEAEGARTISILTSEFIDIYCPLIGCEKKDGWVCFLIAQGSLPVIL